MLESSIKLRINLGPNWDEALVRATMVIEKVILTTVMTLAATVVRRSRVILASAWYKKFNQLNEFRPAYRSMSSSDMQPKMVSDKIKHGVNQKLVLTASYTFNMLVFFIVDNGKRIRPCLLFKIGGY